METKYTPEVWYGRATNVMTEIILCHSPKATPYEHSSGGYKAAV